MVTIGFCHAPVAANHPHDVGQDQHSTYTTQKQHHVHSEICQSDIFGNHYPIILFSKQFGNHRKLERLQGHEENKTSNLTIKGPNKEQKCMAHGVEMRW